MEIESSYFLVTSKQEIEHSTKSRLERGLERLSKSVDSTNLREFLDIFSIILSLNENNIEAFKSLEISKRILLSDFETIDEVKIIYLALVKRFISSKILSQESLNLINDNIYLLSTEGFLERIKYLRLKALVTNLISIKREEKKLSIDEISKTSINEKDRAIYNAKVQQISEVIQALESLIISKELKKRLNVVTDRLHNSKFSIGITGVMNAGKSTMLNAMLKKDILGTSVIPETANLSIIKYSKNEFARVNFWTTQEWQNIKDGGNYSEAIKEFVKDTEEVFANRLSEFISKDGVSKEIPLHELSNYTSAKLSEMKCNLVKSVELYTDLEFVEGGVEIVDTPGIDDPVVQREDITKEYLSKCDVMLHLMNANQSATEKDIEFIIDAILYQNISRLLIVITRIDTVSKDELKEVIAYTKQSIKNQLTKINKDGSIDSILGKIDFVPIAGKMALYHRIGESEKAKGYSIEDTGILEVEAYLSKILFGSESEKAKLIIDGNIKELKSISKEYINLLEDEYQNIGKSLEELETNLNSYQKEKTKVFSKLNVIKSEITSQELQLRDYIKNLNNFVENEIRYFKGQIEKRLYSNISYEYNQGKKLDSDTVKFIIDFGIKDGLFDIIRDYKYQFQTKITQAIEIVEQNYLEFEESTKEATQRDFNSNNLFKNDFMSSFMNEGNQALISSLLSLIDRHSKRSLDKLESELKPILEDSFDRIGKNVSQKAIELNEAIISQFLESLLTPAKAIEGKLIDKEEAIKSQIERITTKTQDDEARRGEIESSIESINLELQKLGDI